MKRAVLAAIGIVVLLFAAGLYRALRAPTPRIAATTQVARGSVVDTLVCRGEFQPKDGIQVKVPFNGRLQFIVDDGSWVEAGAQVFAIGEDEAVRAAAESRSQLLAERQELRLATLRRQATVDQQDRAVTKAQRGLRLEQLRFRIETAAPQGGDALIRLDQELQPLEERTRVARTAAEQSSAAWQSAQDTYLEALDRRSAARDLALRQQTRIDELTAEAQRAVAGLQADAIAARDQAAIDLATVQTEHQTLASALADLAGVVSRTRLARAAAAPARDAAEADVSAAEAAEEEIRIAIEIEKKHLPATQLTLDLASARLSADQAAREAQQADVAIAAGAISQTKLAEQHEAAARTAGQVAILEARLAIASRPPLPERLVELQARIARAETRASAARADRDRAIAIADQDITLAQAKVDRLTYEVESRAVFAEVVQASLAFLDQEIATLDPDDDTDADRLREAEHERTALRERLVGLADTPANVVMAPVAGVVRLQRHDSRPKQVGDEVWEEDILLEIFPPGRLVVAMRVNEVDVARLGIGMPVQITAPALPTYRSGGAITTVSALGRDKLDGTGKVSGVIVFAGEVAITTADPGLRQGMTALVAIELARRDEVLHLPLAAVRQTGEGWTVQHLVGGQVQLQAVQGTPFGNLDFIITDGLQDGDVVAVEWP